MRTQQTKRFIWATCAALLLGQAKADLSPITGGDPGQGDTASDPLTGAIGGLDSVTSTFSSIDSTIAMLSSAIDMLSAVPVIGPIAMMLKPVLNTYLDFKTTAQPLFDAMTKGREYLQKAVDAKGMVQRMFSSSNFQDGLNNINSLVGEMGGLANLPASQRTVNPSDPRASLQPILAAADREIGTIHNAERQARASGDATKYRYLVQREAELKRVRGRLNAAGQIAAAQKDSHDLVTRSSKTAQSTAADTTGYASTLAATKSAEGALKVLGTVALESMNASSAGFDTLSQQLALISQQQTITNEQSDQLLSHFAKAESEKTAHARMVLDQEAERQKEQYTSMVNRVNSLTDGIGQTMKPDATRQTDVHTLMKGQAQ